MKIEELSKTSKFNEVGWTDLYEIDNTFIISIYSSCLGGTDFSVGVKLVNGAVIIKEHFGHLSIATEFINRVKAEFYRYLFRSFCINTNKKFSRYKRLFGNSKNKCRYERTRDIVIFKFEDPNSATVIINETSIIYRKIIKPTLIKFILDNEG
jgi:hypothetical protein